MRWQSRRKVAVEVANAGDRCAGRRGCDGGGCQYIEPEFRQIRADVAEQQVDGSGCHACRADQQIVETVIVDISGSPDICADVVGSRDFAPPVVARPVHRPIGAQICIAAVDEEGATVVRITDEEIVEIVTVKVAGGSQYRSEIGCIRLTDDA